MSRQNPCPQTTFGYLSAVESTEHGFFGGYLLISPMGRPLEFHCTAPVRPSRAQQILYGPTLRPYVVGEQIGGTLLAKSELAPQIVLTDQSAALYLRSQFAAPIVCLLQLEAANDASAIDSATLDFTCPSINGTPEIGGSGDVKVIRGNHFEHLGHKWELPLGHESERETVCELLSSLARYVDLPEPFGRIHEAIREAQRIGEQGPEAYDQAA